MRKCDYTAGRVPSFPAAANKWGGTRALKILRLYMPWPICQGLIVDQPTSIIRFFTQKTVRTYP